MNIEQRYERLLKRRAPYEDRVFARFDESYEKEQGTFTKYILGALRPVDKQYTQKLIDQGDRIENQLKKGLEEQYPRLEFRRQGSVSNYTHIRYSSDIDILTIIDKFHTLEHPQEAPFPYKGEPNSDLLNLRNCCHSHLSNAFPAANVDNTGSTAISIEGGSLYCKVDVVPSNWFNSNDYANYGNEIYRGVQVLDKKAMVRNKNFPFLFNYRIENKDKNRNGLTRMLIRLLKTLRADSDDSGIAIDFSSFDICSVVYRYPDSLLVKDLRMPLSILKNLLDWLDIIIQNTEIRNGLKVVDDSRKIFNENNKLQELAKLRAELNLVYEGAMKENLYGIITESHLN